MRGGEQTRAGNKGEVFFPANLKIRFQTSNLFSVLPQSVRF